MAKFTLLLPEHVHKIQKAIIDFPRQPSDCREMWVACGSKTGKTFGASIAIVSCFQHYSQSMMRWFAPIYSQSKIGYRYCRRFIPTALPSKSHIKNPFICTESPSPRIKLTTTDSEIEFWHANDPEATEGEATRFNVFDECGKYKKGDDLYQSVLTTTTFTLGKILGVSTPLGKNSFFGRKWAKSRDIMEWELKNNKPLSVIALRAPSYINPKIPSQVFDDMRKKLPERIYRQFIEAEFLDFGGIFENIYACTDKDAYVFELEDHEAIWFHRNPDFRRKVVIGADWGKRSDYTIFIAIDCSAKIPRIVGVRRFRKKRYNAAVDELKTFMGHFEHVMNAKHDATGVGDAIDDIIDDQGLYVEGEVFTNEKKHRWVMELLLAFQNTEIILPDWSPMHEELDNYTLTVTASGKYKFEADPCAKIDGEKAHDDIVSALMLAHSAFLESGSSCGVGEYDPIASLMQDYDDD